MTIPTDDMTAYIASLRAHNLVAALIRFDTLYRWNAIDGEFHYQAAVREFEGLSAKMAELKALHDAAEEPSN